jgi:hypothetical protein
MEPKSSPNTGRTWARSASRRRWLGRAGYGTILVAILVVILNTARSTPSTVLNAVLQILLFILLAAILYELRRVSNSLQAPPSKGFHSRLPSPDNEVQTLTTDDAKFVDLQKIDEVTEAQERFERAQQALKHAEISSKSRLEALRDKVEASDFDTKFKRMLADSERDQSNLAREALEAYKNLRSTANAQLHVNNPLHLGSESTETVDLQKGCSDAF